jgi:hypothetical protein
MLLSANIYPNVLGNSCDRMIVYLSAFKLKSALNVKWPVARCGAALGHQATWSRNVDYSDEVGPYAGTVSSVGASGEVCVDFDDGSWAALKTMKNHRILAGR